MAVTFVDVSALDVVEETELELKDHVVLDRDEISLWNLEGVLRNVSQVGQAGLNSLVALLLRILLNLSEGCGAVEDSKALEPLLKNLSVVGCQLERVTVEVKHLDAFKSFKLLTRLSEVTKLIEGGIKAEEIWEVGGNRAESRSLKGIVGHTKMDKRTERVPQRLNLIDEVACEVEFTEVGRQVLDALDFVIGQVEDL